MEHQPIARRPRTRTAVTGLILSALMLTGGLAPASAGAQTVEASVKLKATSSEGVWARVSPAVVAGGSKGVALKAKKAKTVKVKRAKGVPKSARSLVVHVEVLGAAKAGSMRLGGGDAVFSYPKGTSSATTLLTVPASRKVKVTSTAKARVRLTVTGYLKGKSAKTPAPGGTKALTPKVVVDSAKRVGPSLRDSGTTVLPIAGVADVPSSGVRAVWLSVQTLGRGKGTLAVGRTDGKATKVPVASVTKKWSTSLVLAPVNADGQVTYAMKGTRLKALRMTVVGWVAASASTDKDATTKGGLVPVTAKKVKAGKAKTSGSETRRAVKVTGGAIPRNVKAVQMRLTVETTKRAGKVRLAPANTKKAWAKAKGIRVAKKGTHQVLTTATVGKDGRVHLAVPKGAKVRDLAIVSYTATKVSTKRDTKAPTLKITTPKQSATIHLAKTPTIEFSGTVTDTGSGVRRVTVHAGKTLLGAAELDQARGTRTAWKFTTGAPSGKHVLTITATDWAGRTAKVKRTINVKSAGKKDSVVSDEAHFLDAATERRILEVSPTTMAFSGEHPPVAVGQAVVGDPTPAAPGGLLRRVTGVRVENGRVIATTEQATITDVYRQLEVRLDNVPLTAAPAKEQMVAQAQPRGVEVTVPLGSFPLLGGAGEAGLTLDLALAASGGLSVTTREGWVIDVPQLERFSLVFTSKVGTTLEVAASRAARFDISSLRTRKLGQLPPLPLGTSGLHLSNSITLTAGIDGEVKGEVYASYTVSSVIKTGFNCTGTHCEAVQTMEPGDDDGFDAGVRVAFSVVPNMTIGIESLINGWVGAFVGPSFSKWITVERELTSGKRRWGKSFGVALVAEARLGIFKRSLTLASMTLAEWRTPTLWAWLPETPDPTPTPSPSPSPTSDPSPSPSPSPGPDDDEGDEDEEDLLWPPVTPGVVHTWGSATDGATGLGEEPGSTWTPRAVEVLDDAVDVEMADRTGYALTESGEVWGWGVTADGQLGVSDDAPRWSPVRIEGLPPIVDIATTGHATFALDRDGAVWSWGRNRDLALGRDTDVDTDPTPALVPGLNSIRAIYAGRGFDIAFAVDRNGDTWAWGDLYGYQPSLDATSTPRKMVEFPAGVTHIDADSPRALIATSTGEVWAWGSGVSGGGEKTGHGTAYRISSLEDKVIVDVEVADSAYFTVTDDGEVWAWGNLGLVLADGGATDEPVRVDGLPSVAQVEFGQDRAFGAVVFRTTDGRVFTMSNGVYTMMGLEWESGRDYSRPHEVTDLSGVTDITSGMSTGVALVS